MKRITSRQNAIVLACREAARGAEGDVILLDGAHLVGEAIAAGLPLRAALVAAGSASVPDLARLIHTLQARGVEVAEGTPSVMAAISPVRSSSPIVALGARPSAHVDPFAGPTPLVVITCDVQDPGNIGAIVRVAEGAGASGVIVTGQGADPFGWKALRGSMGSVLRLPVSVEPRLQDAVQRARAHGATIVATVPRNGQSLFDTALTPPLALLVGSEGVGLPDAIVAEADVRVTIPMAAPVESLNAAVAAAILLFEARRQRFATTVSR